MRGEERLTGLEAQSLGGWGGGSRELQDWLSKVVAGQIQVLQSPLAAAWSGGRGSQAARAGRGGECVVVIPGRDELWVYSGVTDGAILLSLAH